MWLPCLSLSSRACSSSCPMSWWCHSIISSFVIHFSSWLQSFPASVQFSCSVLSHSFSWSLVSDSLRTRGLQHARPPCPSPTPGACSDSFMSVESVKPSNDLILRLPLQLLPSVFPSFRAFSSESVLIRWPKYWSFSFSISPSNENSRLIFFTIDWFDFLAVQGTLKSLLQHHSSKGSILWHSAFINSHIHTWLLDKPWLWLGGPLLVKKCLCFLICPGWS